LAEMFIHTVKMKLSQRMIAGIQISQSIRESVVQGSRDKAFEYITEYNKNNGGNYLYSIIFEAE